MTEKERVGIVSLRHQMISYFQSLFSLCHPEGDNLCDIQFSIRFCCHIPKFALYSLPWYSLLSSALAYHEQRPRWRVAVFMP